jgi:DICT domain-containing protein
MARLNALVTSSRRGVYWQLIDVGGPDVLTIAVSNQTPESLKDLLRRATVPGFWPPEGNEYGLWTIDLDVMREHANIALSSSSGFPPWVGGKVLVQPSVEGGVVRFDITPQMLA